MAVVAGWWWWCEREAATVGYIPHAQDVHEARLVHRLQTTGTQRVRHAQARRRARHAARRASAPP